MIFSHKSNSRTRTFVKQAKQEIKLPTLKNVSANFLPTPTLISSKVTDVSNNSSTKKLITHVTSSPTLKSKRYVSQGQQLAPIVTPRTNSIVLMKSSIIKQGSSRLQEEKNTEHNEQKSKVVRRGGPPQAMPKHSFKASICSETESGSGSDEEEYDVWDNGNLQVQGVTLDQLEAANHTHKILQLYKIRYGQFPGQQESIDNTTVIKSVKRMARANPKVYRKYFKNGEDKAFNDPVDYSSAPRVSQDENFKKFQLLAQQIRGMQKQQ